MVIKEHWSQSGFANTDLNQQLKQHGIMAANRAGWVRMSPHFYITPNEIDCALNCLA